MTYKPEDYRGELQPSITISDCSGTELYNLIKDIVENYTKERNIPAALEDSVIKSGSLFNKTTVPVLVIRHPDPECKYFSIGVIVNGNIVSFQLFGGSAENYKYNMREQLMKEGNVIKAAFYKPDMFKLEQEQAWIQAVLKCINISFIPEEE